MENFWICSDDSSKKPIFDTFWENMFGHFWYLQRYHRLIIRNTAAAQQNEQCAFFFSEFS